MLPKALRTMYYWLLVQKPVGEWLVYAITFFYHMAIILFHLQPQQDKTALVIVSHKYKFIYLGIPKVASRSFMAAFIEQGRDIYQSEWFETPGDMARVLAQHPHYFKFSIVRNPYARVVSCYNSKISEGVTYSKYVRIMARYKHLKSRISFPDFCRWLTTEEGGDAYADRHWLSQYILLQDENGKAVCDYVGKYESLEEELKIIAEKLSMPLPNLPQRGHISSSSETEEYYTAETRALIAERYARDFKEFGYDS